MTSTIQRKVSVSVRVEASVITAATDSIVNHEYLSVQDVAVNLIKDLRSVFKNAAVEHVHFVVQRHFRPKVRKVVGFVDPMLLQGKHSCQSCLLV